MLSRLRAETRRRMRWRNDLGWTTELARGGDAAEDPAQFGWRVSVAEIDADSEFSEFAGIDRSIAAVDGAGLVLVVDEDVHTLVPGQPPVRLAGEAAASCMLIQGPTRDLNVMTRREHFTHELQVVVMEQGEGAASEVNSGTTIDRADSSHMLIHLAAGTVTVARSHRTEQAQADAARDEQRPIDSAAGAAHEASHTAESTLRAGDSLLCDESVLLSGAGQLFVARFWSVARQDGEGMSPQDTGS